MRRMLTIRCDQGMCEMEILYDERFAESAVVIFGPQIYSLVHIAGNFPTIPKFATLTHSTTFTFFLLCSTIKPGNEGRVVWHCNAMHTVCID